MAAPPAKPVVLEQREDQSRIAAAAAAAAAEVPPPPAPPQGEEHDEIAAQLERMEQGDGTDEAKGAAKGDSEVRCVILTLTRIVSFQER